MKRLLLNGTAALLAAVFFGGSALADQCAWISVGEAKKAAKWLRNSSELLDYCELCGGADPKPVRIQQVEIRQADGGKYREIYVNGDPYDLAYVFVPSRKKEGLYLNPILKLERVKTTLHQLQELRNICINCGGKYLGLTKLVSQMISSTSEDIH